MEDRHLPTEAFPRSPRWERLGRKLTLPVQTPVGTSRKPSQHGTGHGWAGQDAVGGRTGNLARGIAPDCSDGICDRGRRSFIRVV